MFAAAAAADDRPRHVLHVNTDDFFAALARQRDPALRRRSVVVGNLLNRGSVVSASYEAREAGVYPGLTMQQASRLAPEAVQVQVDWGHARHASQALLRLVQGYGARVEPHGFDEAYVDYTGCERIHGAPLDVARQLRNEVRARLDLDVSIGVATNKLVSRFASSSAKRRSVLDVLPGYEASFVAPQPVSRMPGVGADLARRLCDMGVRTVGELACFPRELLEAVWGRLGRRLAAGARGEDRSPVGLRAERAGLMESETFEPDALERAQIEAGLEVACTRLGATLRARGWCAARLVLRLEHSDGVRVQRFLQLATPTHLDTQFTAAARTFLPLLLVRRVRVRRIEVEAIGFSPSPVQLDLFFPDRDMKLRRVLAAADRVRTRYPTAPALIAARALLGASGPGLTGTKKETKTERRHR